MKVVKKHIQVPNDGIVASKTWGGGVDGALRFLFGNNFETKFGTAVPHKPMAEYLSPLHIAQVFNVGDYDFQDISLTLKDSDYRYLRPIKKLQEKTFGIISYNGKTETTNISKNINISHLMNTVDGAIRNYLAVGESLAIGSNLVVGKNIVNSGDIHTSNIFAKSLIIKDAIKENTILTKVFIGDIQVLLRSIALISNLTSDVQLQLDTATTKVEAINATQRIYIDQQDVILSTHITDTDALQRLYIDASYGILNTRITDTDSAQRTYIDASYGTLNTRIMDTDALQRTYIDASYGTLNTRITDTDALQRTYLDASYGTLNTRITDTDALQRTYLDASYGILNTRITDTDALQRTYLDALYGTLNTRITDTDALQRLYTDTSYNTLNTRITDTDSTQRAYIDNKIPSLDAYLLNRGVGALPIYASIDNFEALCMDRHIKGEKESFLILPR
jgi:hypothetical protein